MQKHCVSVLCGCLFTVFVVAQDNNIEQVLQQVAQNNQELKAYQAYIESAALEWSTTNNLPAPQVDAFYLPFGDHTGGDYTEFQVSQSFEFPTVYGARSTLNDRRREELQARLEHRRQAILLKAEQQCYELIYHRQRLAIEETRRQQAQQVFLQVEALFREGQVGILDLNKARIAWLQQQFSVTQVEHEIANALLELENLNGGRSLAFEQNNYPDGLQIASFDSLWNARQQTDVELLALAAQEAVTLQQLKLSRNQSLPNLSAGFNQQGVSGAVYSGFYGGLSIPLWNHRNETKTAKARYNFQQLTSESAQVRILSTYRQQFNRYKLALEKLNEYRATLGSLESEKFLLEAYQLGEISFAVYYTELRFYREAFDQMMVMEKDLYQQKAQLLKHQY